MAIMISRRYMYVQFIDDTQDKTLCSVSSIHGDEKHNNVESATLLGRAAAEAAQKAGIQQVVVDRGGFRFLGRVKAIVDGIVAAGLVAGSAEKPAGKASKKASPEEDAKKESKKARAPKKKSSGAGADKAG